MSEPRPRATRDIGDWSGEQIYEAMGRAGLTQRQLADLAGVSIGTIQNLISGKTKVQAAKRAKVIKALTRDSDLAKNVLSVLQMPFTDAEKLSLVEQLCLSDL